MNIKEKLEQNIDQVNADFQGIKTKIIECGVSVPYGTKTADYGAKVVEVYEAGKKSEYDTFWDNYQQNGTLTNYNYAFSRKSWSDENYKPKYPFLIEYCGGMFEGSGITDTLLPIDFSAVKATVLSWTFASCSKLKTIRTLTVKSSNTFSGTFNGCTALENITFDGSIGNDISFAECNKMSQASFYSIRDHLSDSVTGKTVTFNAGAAWRYWFYHQDEGDDINGGAMDETWESEFCAAKPNWTFSLV